MINEEEKLNQENEIRSVEIGEQRNVDTRRILQESFEQYDFEKIEYKSMSELQCWSRLSGFDFAKKLADLKIVVIDDDEKWKSVYGSNDSKSSYYPKTIILKKEIFDREDISDENLSWLVHEMGHVDFYDWLGEGLNEYMEQYYATGKYTESEIEQKAFEKQFEFLKSIGKTKEECLDMMEKYLTDSFEEGQENKKQQEFEQIKKYLENVYYIGSEEEKRDKEQFLKDKALFDDKSILDESYPEEDPRRYLKLIESEEKNAFNLYLNNLGLSEKMLQGKKIVDIGAGHFGFAGHCLLNKITEEVFSLEPNPETNEVTLETQRMHWGKENERKIKEKTVVGSMLDMSVFADEYFDYAFTHAVMPGVDVRYNDAEKMKESIEKSFSEIIRVLKPGGEARLFPLPDKNNPDKKLWRSAIDEVLSKISAEGLHHIFIEEVVSIEAGEEAREERVIIKKAL